MQSLGTLDELYKHALEIEKNFQEFAKELSKIIGGNFKLGPLKDREIAEKKIDRDYEGKTTLISDVIRGKVIIDSPETIVKLKEILNPDSNNKHPLLKKYGAYCAQLSDYFANPKYETGYRCINAKLSFPIEGTDEEFLVELQGVDKNIEETYDKTHRHMRLAQEITSRYKDERMPNDAAFKRAGHYAVCKYHNGIASIESGLDIHLDNPKRALSEREAESLDKMIRLHRYDY